MSNTGKNLAIPVNLLSIRKGKVLGITLFFRVFLRINFYWTILNGKLGIDNALPDDWLLILRRLLGK